MDEKENELVQSLRELFVTLDPNSNSKENDVQVILEKLNSNETFLGTGLSDWVLSVITEKINITHLKSQLGSITEESWEATSQSIVKNILEAAGNNSVVKIIEADLKQYVNNTIDKYRNACEMDKCKTFEIHNKESVKNYPCFGNPYQNLEGIANERIISECQDLLHIQLSESVLNEKWIHKFKNVRDYLYHDGSLVFTMSLAVHAKLLASPFPLIAKEGFINLIDGLKLYYTRKLQNTLPNVDVGIALENELHQRMLKISHLIIEAAKDMPKNWIKLGEKCVEEMAEHFYTLLTMHIYDGMSNKLSKRFLYPFHIFSTLDPKATWCSRWLYGTFGQKLVFDVMSLHTAVLVKFLVEQVVLYLHVFPSNLHPVTSKISSNAVKYATFTHCCNILENVLHFEKGQNIFVLNKNEPVSLQEFMTLLVKHLNSHIDLNPTLNSVLGREHLIKIISVVVKEEYKLIHYANLLKFILEPIQTVNESKSFKKKITVAKHMVIVLHSMANTPFGVQCLWRLGQKPRVPMVKSLKLRSHKLEDITESSIGLRKLRNPKVSIERQNSTKSLRFASSANDKVFYPAKFIFDYTVFLLSHENVTDTHTLTLLIDICGRLLGVHEGILRFVESDSPLVPTVLALYRSLTAADNGNELSCATKEALNAESRTLLECVLRFLVRLVTTPCGLWLVARKGGPCEAVLHHLLGHPHMAWDEVERRLAVTSVISLARETGVLGKHRGRILSAPLLDVWETYEDAKCLLKGLESCQIQAVNRYINILLCLASNLQGVKALLGDDDSSEGTLVESRWPTSLADLLMWDGTCEARHYVGLLSLRVLTSCLDSCLFLNATLHFQKYLLHFQSENVTNPISEGGNVGKDIIVDRCSLLQHQILVATYEPGGPTEKVVPHLSLDRDIDVPVLFSSYPPPEEYYRGKPRRPSGEGNQLHVYLRDASQTVHDVIWLSNARKAYKLSCMKEIKECTLLDLIKQISDCFHSLKSVIEWRESDSSPLCSEELLGVELTIRYGIRLGLLRQSPMIIDSLVLLMKLSPLYRANLQEFQGFDWFLATIFLLCHGNIARCQNCIGRMSVLPVLHFLWPVVYGQSDFNYCCNFGHQLEFVVSIELPLAAAALQLGGLSWWVVCHDWMRQCFWNVLDWSDICHWLVICFLHPPDFALYFCVSLLKHLQPKILEASSCGTVWDQIKLTPVQGFLIADYLPYMEKLAKRYRTSVLHHLLME